MAKSIRSKRERKLRAIKRVRYGVKELERLKKTLHNDPVNIKEKVAAILNETSTSTRTTTPKEANTSTPTKSGPTVKHKFNPKTMKDQFGNYPVWMHRRKIQKNKRKSNKK